MTKRQTKILPLVVLVIFFFSLFQFFASNENEADKRKNHNEEFQSCCMIYTDMEFEGVFLKKNEALSAGALDRYFFYCSNYDGQGYCDHFFGIDNKDTLLLKLNKQYRHKLQRIGTSSILIKEKGDNYCSIVIGTDTVQIKVVYDWKGNRCNSLSSPNM